MFHILCDGSLTPCMTTEVGFIFALWILQVNEFNREADAIKRVWSWMFGPVRICVWSVIWATPTHTDRSEGDDKESHFILFNLIIKIPFDLKPPVRWSVCVEVAQPLSCKYQSVCFCPLMFNSSFETSCQTFLQYIRKWCSGFDFSFLLIFST